MLVNTENGELHEVLFHAMGTNLLDMQYAFHLCSRGYISLQQVFVHHFKCREVDVTVINIFSVEISLSHQFLHIMNSEKENIST
jgi:hypothetical protein